MEKIFIKLAKMNTVIFYCVVLLFEVLWSAAIVKILHYYGVTEFSQNTADISWVANHLFLLPFAALLEELTYRWSPMLVLITCILVFFKEDRMRFKIEKYGIAVIVLVTSILFGYAHGNEYNILIQGVGGLMIFVVYLRSFYKERIKEKNWKSEYEPTFMVKPLFSSTIYHTLFNVTVFVLYIITK